MMVGFFVLWGLAAMNEDKTNQNNQSKEKQKPSDDIHPK